jgi:hypothetical protein
MRLLQCLACHDVLRLTELDRRCQCLRSRGRLDGESIEILGPARVLSLFGDDGFDLGAAEDGRWVTLREGGYVRRPPTRSLSPTFEPGGDDAAASLV